MADNTFTVTFDGNLDKFFKRLDSKRDFDGVPKALKKSAQDVMFDWWKLAGTGQTGAPLDTGTLRASISAGLQGQFLKTPSFAKAEAKAIAKSFKDEVNFALDNASKNTEFQKNRKFQILGIIGANTEYAAAVHENVNRGKISGRGKYIEANGRESAKRWGKFIARRMKKDFES